MCLFKTSNGDTLKHQIDVQPCLYLLDILRVCQSGVIFVKDLHGRVLSHSESHHHTFLRMNWHSCFCWPTCQKCQIVGWPVWYFHWYYLERASLNYPLTMSLAMSLIPCSSSTSSLWTQVNGTYHPQVSTSFWWGHMPIVCSQFCKPSLRWDPGKRVKTKFIEYLFWTPFVT